MEFFLSCVVGTIGLAYFAYGKKTSEFSFMLSGLLLMIYPYFISSLTLSFIIGGILSVCPFILR